MGNFGDFISLDDAVDILERRGRFGGCYFCLTFDDGYKNCLTNAMPILVERGCVAAVYLQTEDIGLDREDGYDLTTEQARRRMGGGEVPVEFLNWDDCRALRKAGMILGSHTHTHARLGELSEEAAEQELRLSKDRIEKELRAPCRHFAAPWGRPGLDYDPALHPLLAKRVGYSSFATTQRGANRSGSDPYHLRRDHLLASSENYHLKYWLSRS